MTEADRIKYLRIVLVLIGLLFIFGVWPLTILWPSGWVWHAAKGDATMLVLRNEVGRQRQVQP